MKLRPKRQAGFTLVEILIVVAIIGLLAAVAIPNMIKARNQAQTQSCIANLKTIDGAKQQWGLENRKATTDVPTTTEVAAYLKATELPLCPGGGTYTLNTIGANTTCTIPGHELQ